MIVVVTSDKISGSEIKEFFVLLKGQTIRTVVVIEK